MSAEEAKVSSSVSRDDETVLWRPALIKNRDLYDYESIFKFRQEKAIIKNMGFISAFENQNFALRHLVQKHKELQNNLLEVQDQDKKYIPHDSLVQDGVPTMQQWDLSSPRSSDSDIRLPALFKLNMKQETDFFKLDSFEFSPYFAKETEVLVQDAVKFKIVEIRHITYKNLNITELTLDQM